MAFWNRRARRAAVERADRAVGGHIVGLDPRRKGQPWQDRARVHAANMGVVKFAFGLVSSLAARCPLVPEYSDDGRNWTPNDDGAVRAALDRYRGEQETQADLVYRSVWLYNVLGEYVQVVYDAPHMLGVVAVRDPVAIEKRGEKYLVKNSPVGRERDGTAFVVEKEQVRRLWRPDPQWHDLADSPLHGVLADCDRYHALGRAIVRGARSRLVVNGVIWTPAEAHEAALLPEEEQTDYVKSSLERDYVAMSELSYLDEDDTPASAAPLMVNWSKDHGPPVKVDLTRPWDGQLLALRNEALEAIARGLPLPAQLVIAGPGAGGNRWGDWLADEHQSRIISGQLERVCADITDTYFRPTLAALAQRGVWSGDAARWRVGYDLTPIVVHPDLSAVAVELLQLGAIGFDAALRETGFDDGDAPTADDMRRLAEVFAMRKQAQPGSNGNGLGVDGSSVRKGPPLTPGRAGSLKPYPAELAGWQS